ncbi:ATP-binding protein [Nodularia spumigena]|uniref:ATP-binding protein n=1 Tax=Nodularia spumigena TaxID=70799 RepID=UPI00232E3813|nr:ATP-binding protein [Nodularia spumigena]MDB9317182.1 ATP-binding protein [Nodularia spumigena CS-590/01A]MDB9327304.1 ATP-binding protein [Nodularia spumigena CS-590/02]MDB9334581.1 ATP-binding protein [Nodularia spumigena CS-590/01]
MNSNPHDIVPAHLAVQAMRDNGYKNAAYAIAELMDNAIQAGASQVELLCGERKQQVEERKRSRIEQIAVLDNGKGMDADVLRLALQFGNGTYLAEDKHTGIGRFGMGLPSSSISQCQRFDVWTWQNGVENALHSYLDLEEIKSRQMTEVPEPITKQIPIIWAKVGSNFGQSGTLVVWSKIDRCMWRTGKAIIDNSELLIGRMYRKFLNSGQVKIRMMAFDLDIPHQIITEKYALPNDPCYLMEKTSCPSPFHNTPMFEIWHSEAQETYEATFSIKLKGQIHDVKVRFTYAKEEARRENPEKPNVPPGSLPHGKHAAKNVGISVVRAGRELELDQTLVNNYDPTERWWGIEVEFPPALDELFGVTNNKQSARNFSEILALDIKSLQENGKTEIEIEEEMREDEDPKLPLLKMVQKIEKQLSSIRGWLDKQTKGTKGNRQNQKRYEEIYKPIKIATNVTQERKDEGYKGKSDQDEDLPQVDRKQIIKQTLTEEGATQEQAELIAATIVEKNLKYEFHDAYLDTPAFFSVQSKGGAIIVTLNRNHPAHKNLVEVLEKDVQETDIDTLRSRLINSLGGLKLLLFAWARYEDEQLDVSSKHTVQEVRFDWGTIAKRFLETEL